MNKLNPFEEDILKRMAEARTEALRMENQTIEDLPEHIYLEHLTDPKVHARNESILQFVEVAASGRMICGVKLTPEAIAVEIIKLLY